MSFLTRTTSYLAAVSHEFRTVTFPSRRDVAVHTMVVVAAIIAMIIFLAVVDSLFAFLVKLLLANA